MPAQHTPACHETIFCDVEEELPGSALRLVTELSHAREIAAKLYRDLLEEEPGTHTSVGELLAAVDQYLSPIPSGEESVSP
jgi:hypothetical protein